ncbi:MAG: ATP-binding protein [Armatimonadota bacterium]|jgi:serine/threonine-protein kinase RsbW
MADRPEDTVELVVPNERKYLHVVRLAVSGVASRAGFSVAEIEDIKLAVGEACTNAMEHAYEAGDETATIRIRCRVEPEAFVVEVVDEGQGFDPDDVTIDPSAPPPTERGLGLFLVSSSVDRLDIDTAPGAGTKVTMVKKTPRAGDAG